MLPANRRRLQPDFFLSSIIVKFRKRFVKFFVSKWEGFYEFTAKHVFEYKFIEIFL